MKLYVYFNDCNNAAIVLNLWGNSNEAVGNLQ